MRVFVTGGAGFIGSACVWRLNRAGVDDIVIVDRLGTDDKWKNLVPLRFADIVTPEQLLADPAAFAPDAIIHMGACSATTERDADFLLTNNFRYTRTLAHWADKNRVRFVYASSAATYGDGEQGFNDDPARVPDLSPLNMYGYSKQLFDSHALRSNLFDSIVGLKFFNVFGPNEYHKADMTSVVFKAYHQITATGTLNLFQSERPDYLDGEQVRDFVYVKDVADVVLWLLEHPDVCGLYNVGTGRARTWNDLGRAIFAALDRTPKIEYVPLPDTLRGRYQYRTEAAMDRLAARGCPVPAQPLENSVRDYVQNYLATGVRPLHPRDHTWLDGISDANKHGEMDTGTPVGNEAW